MTDTGSVVDPDQMRGAALITWIFCSPALLRHDPKVRKGKEVLRVQVGDKIRSQVMYHPEHQVFIF